MYVPIFLQWAVSSLGGRKWEKNYVCAGGLSVSAESSNLPNACSHTMVKSIRSILLRCQSRPWAVFSHLISAIFCSGREMKTFVQVFQALTKVVVWKQQQPTAPTCRASLSLWVSLPGPAQCHFGSHINTHTHSQLNLIWFIPLFSEGAEPRHLSLSPRPSRHQFTASLLLFGCPARLCAHVYVHLICIHVHTELCRVTEKLTVPWLYKGV